MDFKESLNKGLKAYENVVKEKEEIINVFRDLNEQIKELGIKIEIRPKKELIKKSSGLLVYSLRPQEYIFYSSIDVIKNEKYEELSKWEQKGEGYPCIIKTKNTEYSCYDKESLEKSLIYLLETPETGKTIKKLLNDL